jgi:predicted O-linked N-acetylglucosamine transferase (SPINDLY family)
MAVSADTKNQEGIAFCRQGEWEAAIACFETVLELTPKAATTRCNLGFALLQVGRIETAIACFQTALASDPTLFQAHHNLGVALTRQHHWEEAIACFQTALQLAPNFAEAHYNLGTALMEQHRMAEAIASLQQATQLAPNFAEAYYNLGRALARQQRLEEAIAAFRQAVQLQPTYADAYASLCHALHQSGNLAEMYDVATAFCQICQGIDEPRAPLLLMRAALYRGLRQTALEALTNLETIVYRLAQSTHAAANATLASLYPEILFNLPYLRDDVAANNQLAQLVAHHYFEQRRQTVGSPPGDRQPNIHPKPTQLRIGIISPYFNRVSEGWCSRDILRELAILNPKLYLYATARFKPDDLTTDFETTAHKFYLPPSLDENIYLENENEVLAEIQADQLDVLIDFASVMNVVHPKILHHRPAPVCLSWLGFEPPMISPYHYFLSDWHLQPSGIEQHYAEQIIRLPDSFIAVSGFPCDAVNVTAARAALGIAKHQVAYLCMSIGLKFSEELAQAQVQILQQVPDSLLLHKGSGDTDKAGAGSNMICDTYQRECDRQGVDFDRIRFLGRTRTEEEHRTIYQIADVLLDTYPFNGVTHTLEALWFQLPTVTLVGQQLYARASYSFMQSVGLSAGIAQSWTEYVEWGIRLGCDRHLRDSIQAQLAQAKQSESLAPLWNPRKFAADFLEILHRLCQ